MRDDAVLGRALPLDRGLGPNSPSGSTLQCDTWLWDDMPLTSRKRSPYCNSTSVFDFDHITAVDMSSCTSLRNFIQIGLAEKMTSCRFSSWQISAILDFEKATYDFRTSTDIIAINCLVFEKNPYLHFGVKIQDCGSPLFWILGAP